MDVLILIVEGGNPGFEGVLDRLLRQKTDDFLRRRRLDVQIQVVEVAGGDSEPFLDVGPVGGRLVAAGQGLFAHHYSIAGGLAGYMVGGAAAVGEPFGRHPHYIDADEQVTIEGAGLVAGRPAGRHIGFFPILRPLVGDDYQQIHIGIVAVVAPGAGAEQDDGNGAHRLIHRLGDGLGARVIAGFDGRLGSHCQPL